jgi:hypothetical protein
VHCLRGRPCILIIELFTAAAGFAVAAAFFCCFSRGGKHLPAIAPLGGLSAVGTKHFVVMLFYKFLKAFVAVPANIL